MLFFSSQEGDRSKPKLCYLLTTTGDDFLWSATQNFRKKYLSFFVYLLVFLLFNLLIGLTKITGLLFNLQLRKQFEERSRLMEVNIQNGYYFFNVFAHQSFLIWCSHSWCFLFWFSKKNKQPKRDTDKKPSRFWCQFPPGSNAQMDVTVEKQLLILPVRNRCSYVQGPERLKMNSFR